MATRTPQPMLLDTEILDDLHAMLGDEVDRLIDVFLDDTPRLVQALENAAAGPKSNWPTAFWVRYCDRKVVALPGPPPVSTNGSV